MNCGWNEVVLAPNDRFVQDPVLDLIRVTRNLGQVPCQLLPPPSRLRRLGKSGRQFPDHPAHFGGTTAINAVRLPVVPALRVAAGTHANAAISAAFVFSLQ